MMWGTLCRKYSVGELVGGGYQGTLSSRGNRDGVQSLSSKASAATDARESGSRRPRVLTFAYACEPQEGSEPGGVWGLVRAAMDFADCIVLVGPEHIAGLRRWQESNDSRGTDFVVIEEPRWGRFAKWHRIGRFIVYQAWLRKAAVYARGLLQRNTFDLSWHASFAVYWLPSPAVDLGIPSVWGPVGGAVTTPIRLWRYLGPRGILGEILDAVSVWAMARRSATRKTWKRATMSLLNSEETLRRLPPEIQKNSRVLNQALFADVVPGPARPRRPYVLFPSVLEPRKGPRLAIAALAASDSDVRMTIVHEGPEEPALRRMAARLGVADRVEFMGRVPRSQMFEMLAEAGAALFTGLREDGGMALCEAMLHGTPTIVLAHGGARVIGEKSSDPTRTVLVRPGSAAGTAHEIGKAMNEFLHADSAGASPTIDQSPIKEALKDAFEAVLGITRSGESSSRRQVGLK
jgi:glycosyltransferase involved in cell wall biosynthesis